MMQTLAMHPGPTRPHAVKGRSSQAHVEAIPADAAMVMSALDVGSMILERRSETRTRFRSRATLRLFNSRQVVTSPVTLFTRDMSHSSVGFVTREVLPLGARGVVEVPTADGGVQRLACTVVRCRELTPDWYGGSLYFCRQPSACMG